jgi:hypothetical protein
MQYHLTIFRSSPPEMKIPPKTWTITVIPRTQIRDVESDLNCLGKALFVPLVPFMAALPIGEIDITTEKVADWFLISRRWWYLMLRRRERLK